MGPMVGNLEKAVAAKMTGTPGPATAPKGWTQGKKTGWKGGTVPPGLARVRAGLQGKPMNKVPKPPKAKGTGV